MFQLETEGIALACISYLDNASTASMRYTIRRMRRKLPGAIMVLGCWTEADPSRLQEIVKADEVVNTLGAGLTYAIVPHEQTRSAWWGAGTKARIDKREGERGVVSVSDRWASSRYRRHSLCPYEAVFKECQPRSASPAAVCTVLRQIRNTHQTEDIQQTPTASPCKRM